MAHPLQGKDGSSNLERPPKSTNQSRRRPGPKLKACGPCRVQKLRCSSGEQPCPHCKRRNTVCFYNVDERVRAPARRIDEQQQQESTASSSSSSLPESNAASTTSSALASGPGSISSSPTYSYSSKFWFDWLLTFFGSNRQSGRRMVSFLLNNAFTHSHYYWFDMWHMATIRRAGNSERERENVHPSLVFGMVAIGLRQRQSKRRIYGMGIGETLIADEVIPPPSSSEDLSEAIKEAANTFLEQDLTSPNRDTQSWLGTAKAALMLMQLERELSPRYLHLLGVAMSIMRNSNLHQALKSEASSTTGNRFQSSPLQKPDTPDASRSSIEIEEAARLALLPIWAGTRIGLAYFNVETFQTGFKPEDLTDSYVFAPWPDKQQEESQRRPEGSGIAGTAQYEEQTNNIQARILGLNTMYTNYVARFLPYGLDYNSPTSQLNSVLRSLDNMDFMYGMMVEELDWLEASFFRMMMMRFTTCVCHLQGILIRRLGFAHSDSLREAISSKSRDSQESSPSTQRQQNLRFESAVFRGWCQVQKLYITEIDLDYMSANGQAHLLQVTKFQSDVIRLYWLGTRHFYEGVKKALRLAGVDHRKDEVAQLLHSTAQELGKRIQRHDLATLNRTLQETTESSD